MRGRERGARNAVNELEGRIHRLVRLAGSDEGFFVLALHSFIEAYVCDDLPRLAGIDHFPDLLWQYGEHLKTCGCALDDLKNVTRLIKEHALTNQVRHSFLRLDKEEVRAATHNFLGFCALCRHRGAGSCRSEAHP